MNQHPNTPPLPIPEPIPDPYEGGGTAVLDPPATSEMPTQVMEVAEPIDEPEIITGDMGLPNHDFTDMELPELLGMGYGVNMATLIKESGVRDREELREYLHPTQADPDDLDRMIVGFRDTNRERLAKQKDKAENTLRRRAVKKKDATLEKLDDATLRVEEKLYPHLMQASDIGQTAVSKIVRTIKFSRETNDTNDSAASATPERDRSGDTPVAERVRYESDSRGNVDIAAEFTGSGYLPEWSVLGNAGEPRQIVVTTESGERYLVSESSIYNATKAENGVLDRVPYDKLEDLKKITLGESWALPDGRMTDAIKKVEAYLETIKADYVEDELTPEQQALIPSRGINPLEGTRAAIKRLLKQARIDNERASRSKMRKAKDLLTRSHR